MVAATLCCRYSQHDKLSLLQPLLHVYVQGHPAAGQKSRLHCG